MLGKRSITEIHNAPPSQKKLKCSEELLALSELTVVTDGRIYRRCCAPKKSFEIAHLAFSHLECYNGLLLRHLKALNKTILSLKINHIGTGATKKLYRYFAC